MNFNCRIHSYKPFKTETTFNLDSIVPYCVLFHPLETFQSKLNLENVYNCYRMQYLYSIKNKTRKSLFVPGLQRL